MTISLDFDGVLHSYTRGWTGIAPLDPPMKGAVEFCEWLHAQGHKIVISSCRSNFNGGGEAILAWLKQHGFPEGIRVSLEKPIASLYVDDNGFRFEGSFDRVKKFMESEKERKHVPVGISGRPNPFPKGSRKRSRDKAG